MEKIAPPSVFSTARMHPSPRLASRPLCRHVALLYHPPQLLQGDKFVVNSHPSNVSHGDGAVAEELGTGCSPSLRTPEEIQYIIYSRNKRWTSPKQASEPIILPPFQAH
ncbi:hypothetical protein EMCRGX_G006322 [Ephydatia muelleri]